MLITSPYIQLIDTVLDVIYFTVDNESTYTVTGETTYSHNTWYNISHWAQAAVCVIVNDLFHFMQAKLSHKSMNSASHDMCKNTFLFCEISVDFVGISL